MANQNLSRREFLRLAGLTATAGIVAACAPAGGTSTGASSSADAPGAEAVEITFMGWGGTEEDEGVRVAIEVFQEETPGVTVTWLHTPDNYAEKLLANIAAQTPPDTAFIGSGDYRTYIRDGLLLDITDQLEGDSLLGAEDYFIQPQEFERCTSQGRWYGIGSCWVAPHFYYNADIFAAQGIEGPSNDPDEAWTWDEFLEIARQLTIDDNGNNPGDSGFDVENVKQWGVHWPTWSIPVHSAIAGNGGTWSDPETELLTLDTPEATEAIQAIADLMHVHQVMPQSTAFESLGMTNTQMLETGQLAMAVDGSWALAWMHKIDATLGTGVIPGLKEPATDMQAHLHSALSGSDHPDEAWQWVRFLSTPFYQTQFCKIGLWLPSQTGLTTDEGLESWLTEGVHPEDYIKIPTEFLTRHGHVLYQTAGWPKASSIVQPAFDAIFNGDQNAADAMAAVVPEANKVLEEELAKGS